VLNLDEVLTGVQGEGARQRPAIPPALEAEIEFNVERMVELGPDVLEATRLDPVVEGLGVAVHGVAAPEHRVTGALDRLFDRYRRQVGRRKAFQKAQKLPSRRACRTDYYRIAFIAHRD